MSSVEFYVRNVVRTPTAANLVIGVVNSGEMLLVGDRFGARYEVDQDDIMNGVANPSRLNCFAVDLAIEKIDVMRNEVPQLSYGVTAALSLSESGLEHVKTGCFLRTEES